MKNRDFHPFVHEIEDDPKEKELKQIIEFQ